MSGTLWSLKEIQGYVRNLCYSQMIIAKGTYKFTPVCLYVCTCVDFLSGILEFQSGTSQGYVRDFCSEKCVVTLIITILIACFSHFSYFPIAMKGNTRKIFLGTLFAMNEVMIKNTYRNWKGTNSIRRLQVLQGSG